MLFDNWGGRQQMLTNVENEYKVTMTLHIRNITRSHFGGYRCVVRNSLGETDGLIRVYGIYSVSCTSFLPSKSQ